jgi:hypothetical protein
MGFECDRVADGGLGRGIDQTRKTKGDDQRGGSSASVGLAVAAARDAEPGDDGACAYQATLVSGGERSAICRDVSRSIRTMGPPQIGQIHKATGSGEVGMRAGVETGAAASSC